MRQVTDEVGLRRRAHPGASTVSGTSANIASRPACPHFAQVVLVLENASQGLGDGLAVEVLAVQMAERLRPGRYVSATPGALLSRRAAEPP